MREIRPQVVITFDPHGGYGHPDHIAAHRATVAALPMAGDPQVDIAGLPPYAPPKLYYHTFPRDWLRWAVRLLPLFGADPRHFGKNRDLDLVEVLAGSLPVHASISIRSVADVKERASACHVSQGGGMPRGPLAWLMRLASSKDQYTRAVPVEPPQRVEHDLFDGVGGE